MRQGRSSRDTRTSPAGHGGAEDHHCHSQILSHCTVRQHDISSPRMDLEPCHGQFPSVLTCLKRFLFAETARWFRAISENRLSFAQFCLFGKFGFCTSCLGSKIGRAALVTARLGCAIGVSRQLLLWKVHICRRFHAKIHRVWLNSHFLLWFRGN